MILQKPLQVLFIFAWEKEGVGGLCLETSYPQALYYNSESSISQKRQHDEPIITHSSFKWMT